jgi:type IV pilus assembly protein PilV
MKFKTMEYKKSQHGSILLESLISVLLFTIGVIGLMSVAATSTSLVGQSKYRNDASNLVGELVAGMWIDPQPPLTFDQTAWQARVASALPNGVGIANVDVATGTKVDILVTWDDLKVSGMTHKYATTVEVARN